MSQKSSIVNLENEETKRRPVVYIKHAYVVYKPGATIAVCTSKEEAIKIVDFKNRGGDYFIVKKVPYNEVLSGKM